MRPVCLTDRLDPHARIAIAAVCSARAALLTRYPTGQPTPRSLWLAVTLGIYWLVWRGSVGAWRIAWLLAALVAAVYGLVVFGNSLARTLDARLVLLACMYWLGLAMVGSRMVMDYVTRAHVRSAK